MALEFVELPTRPADWDARIQGYDGKTIFHETCWLDHVADIHPQGRAVYATIHRDGADVGVFVGLRMSRGFVKLLGSPMPGTGTNFAGPLVDRGVPMEDVIAALLAFCRRTRVMHLEMASPLLDNLDATRIGLEAHRSVTHVVPLASTADAAWAGLQSTCRNRVRKAEKAGLEVEVTSDPSVVTHFYEQYIEVYGKQGLVLPFGVDRGQSLFDRLLPAGRVLPMWVKKDGEILAAGLFPFDQHAIYFWGAASWMRFQHLCPNELLHWAVMKEAVARGIGVYNMCGGNSRFKDKFGGSDVPYVRYSRSFVPGLVQARNLYARLHRQRLRMAGWFRPRAERPQRSAESAE